MKVLLINGSPHPKGCTYTALSTVAKQLEKHGLSTQMLHIGHKAVRGCIACGKCAETGRCIFTDDPVNEGVDLLRESDALVVGSPVYYAGPNATEFARARAFLGQNNLQAAKAVLDNISIRNAEWYYLYGIIYLRQGWFDKAREYLTIAYQQEPGNAEYASAYNTIRHTGNPYARQAGAYQSNCSPCDICAGAMCFSSFGVPCCCWC